MIKKIKVGKVRKYIEEKLETLQKHKLLEGVKFHNEVKVSPINNEVRITITTTSIVPELKSPVRTNIQFFDFIVNKGVYVDGIDTTSKHFIGMVREDIMSKINEVNEKDKQPEEEVVSEG